jgi:hypothetical protein
MKRLIVLICSCVGLIGLTIWLTHYFELVTAVAITGIIGTAATVAALVGESKRQRKAHFSVSDAWLQLRGGDDYIWSYDFSAVVVNDGDEPDVLTRIDPQFYHERFGFIRSELICGGKPITATTGHVLPISCAAQVTYQVEGNGIMVIIHPIMQRVVAITGWEGYILRCTFRFAHARPITIRATRNGLSQKSSASHALHEILLRIKTRNKNPFTDA